MKKTQEILGLPIISISDGMEAGRVKGIIINSEKGSLDYIAVDSGIQVCNTGVIPASAVLGIGEYALTIEDKSSIADISSIPAAVNLVQQDIRVAGTRVMTRKGRLVGEIGDIYIDEDNNCTIAGLEFTGEITQNRVRLIPHDTVITFGKNLTVVKEDIDSALVDGPDQLTAGGAAPEQVDAGPAAQADAFIFNSGNSAYTESAQPFEEAAAPGEEEDGSAAVLFEQRQRQYLLGRKATRTIIDSAGNVIIEEGAVIDEYVIDDAKAKGKLIELVMNNRA